MAQKHRNKRIILVNRDLQFRYAKIAFLLGLASTVLSAMIVVYPLFAFEILRIPKFLPTPVLAGMVFAAVLNLAFILYFSIIITHRIAGPMFTLSREFAEMSQGIFGRNLSARKTDDLRYLIRCYNDMSLCLKNISLDDQEELDKLHKQAQELHSSLQKWDTAASKDDDKNPQKNLSNQDQAQKLAENILNLKMSIQRRTNGQEIPK
ncbi:MAG: hypothetical protein OXC44_05860 [Proteobacteria bacterium]|nr:hypothetical protein [Pseudomonadota bacterium]